VARSDPTIVPSSILADVTAPLSIVKVPPLLLIVISPLSPSEIPDPISVIELSSFLVNNLPLSVRNATSPTTRSLALGLLPEPLFSLI